MIDLHIALDEERFQHLQRRARERGVTVEHLVADLIDADLHWQATLADDPMTALFGGIDDSLDAAEIDAIVYSSTPR